jgi:AraC-like DNA-binding protein
MFTLKSFLLPGKQSFLKGGGMNLQPRVSAVAASGVLGLIGQCGGDHDRILGAARLDVREIANPAAQLDLRRYCDLFEQAARQTGVDNFGLRFGRGYEVETIGPLARLALNSPTLGAALNNLCRYFPALQEHSTLGLREDGSLMRLEYQIRDGRITNRRQDAELSIGIFSNFFRRCFGARWSPEEVHFEHLRGAEAGAHQSLLNAPVYFAQSTNAILFRRSDLAAPMPGANPALLPALHAELSCRAASARPDDFAGQVVQEIRANFAAGEPSIDKVASSLGVSRATLYRRLAAAGLDFSRATQTVRQELALIYAAQPHIQFAEIAALLGYSEPSAFTRAFRRWTGVSPAAYRKRFA